MEIILGEFSCNCIIRVHVEVQKEKETFAVMCLRRGVHKRSKKINDYDVKPPDLTF